MFAIWFQPLNVPATAMPEWVALPARRNWTEYTPLVSLNVNRYMPFKHGWMTISRPAGALSVAMLVMGAA